MSDPLEMSLDDYIKKNNITVKNPMWRQQSQSNTRRTNDFSRNTRHSDFEEQWQEEDEYEEEKEFEENRWRNRDKRRLEYRRSRREADYRRGDQNSRWPNITASRQREESSSEQSENEQDDEEAKLFVFNLHPDVPSNDLKELFAAIGPVKAATIHHDRLGRALGTADVTYEKKSAAIRAIKEYDGVPLDGLTMKLELIRTAEELGIPRTGYQRYIAKKRNRRERLL